MPNQIVTKGIILSRTDFGEADRILTVLTPDAKVSLMAKGVRKATSKLAGGIELFSVSQLTFIPGKGEVNTLISTRLEKHYGNITKDIDRTMFGYEALKLINRATEDMTGNEYFELAEKIFEALDDYRCSIEQIKLWMYLQLLKVAGHSPNLRTSKFGQKLQEDTNFTFNLEDMSFQTAQNGMYTPQHIKLLRLALGLEIPKPLCQIKNSNKVLPECLLLSKTMLQQYVKI